MLNYDFKTFISDGTEFYGMMVQELDTKNIYQRTAPFPSSQLSFLDLDIDAIAPIFKKISDDLWSLTVTHDKKYEEPVCAALNSLEVLHIYFVHLRLDWGWRVSRALMLGDYSENLLQRRALLHMAETLKTMQGQIREIFANVLDMDGEQKPALRKMADYYRRDGQHAFQFRPYPMSFELLNTTGTFAEVLCPDTLYDLIDYHLRECVKREIRMRVCKNCGRYFAVTGHGGTEYCDRVYDKKGRTCREIGAVTVWTKKRKSDDVFTAYRREYKKRFAWIKAGKIEPEAFYAWGEEARRKKAACEAGEISHDEFMSWLKHDG